MFANTFLSKKSDQIVLFLLMVFNFLIYRQTLNTFFVQDDFWFLAATQKVELSKHMIFGVLPVFIRPIPTYWFPLLNRFLWGLNPFGFHLTQIIVFITTVYFLYKTLQQLTKDNIASLIGTFIYSLSKVHVFTLGWISGAIDNLAAMFFIIAFWAIIKYLQDNKGLVLVFVSFLLALFSKESVAILPFAVLGYRIYDWYINGCVLEKVFNKIKQDILLKLLFVTFFLYLFIWFNFTDRASGGTLGFDLKRLLLVLEYSIISLLPVSSTEFTLSFIGVLIFGFLIIALLILSFMAFCKRNKKNKVFPNLLLGILLWVLPASIFVITKIPEKLQLYYAGFSIFGISIVISVLVALILKVVKLKSKGYMIKGLFIFAFVAYLFVLGTSTQTVIKQNGSPSLFEAQYSEAAFKQLDFYLSNKQYKEVIILQPSDLMWWAMGKGAMIPVMFPGVTARFEGHDPIDSDETITSQTTC